MDTDVIKAGLDGLSKIDGITDKLFNIIYWVGVLFVIFFVAYLYLAVINYLDKRKHGMLEVDKDDFLEY